MNPMEESEALAKLLGLVKPMPVEHVELEKAGDRVLAEDIRARMDGPPFANSAMDGYALHAADLAAAGNVEILGTQPAGRCRGLAVRPGGCVRVFTGAPLPRDAAAVIMREEVEEHEAFIRLRGKAEAGENIRPSGGDVAEGQLLLRKGVRLGAAAIALLASQGFQTVPVGNQPRAAIAATGDELRPPGQPLLAGEIYESNLPMLHLLAKRWGARVFPETSLRDETRALAPFFEQGLECDFLVVSGGVSVGDRDLVRPVLEQLGVKIELWRVNLKPGKPLLFGSRGPCVVLGLPGNPVSSFVTALIFLRPAILASQGARGEALELPRFAATAGETIANTGNRPHYLRGELRDGVFTPAGLQQSHALGGLARANALLRLDPGKTVAKGSPVVISPLDC